jgi:hypothetical protein
MSFTRFHDDPCRVEKQLQESTGPGRYLLNTPGNGDKPCFMEDPFIRLQKWGANLRTHPICIGSDLRGLTRPLTLDCTEENNYATHAVQSAAVTYPTCLPTTDQTRATNPAWTARDLEQVDWWTLPLDPQENVCIPFHNNLSTRILEKDYFVAQAPCLAPSAEQQLPTRPFRDGPHAAPTICTSTDACLPVST